MKNKILKVGQLGPRWETSDPFLFCVHHHDQFPKGNDDLGPEASLSGRNIGNDFANKDGWNMYHGDRIPGFPEHPHVGFETVTIVLDGFIDHFDSTGSKGRFGAGDVQWMTAGKGARHSEIFPLVNQEQENPTELFQIWLNLSKKNKKVDPHYKMLWAEDIPQVEVDESNHKTTVRIISGQFNQTSSLEPSPGSWAKEKDHHVTILLIKMEPHAKFKLPEISYTLNRTLYFYQGDHITIDDRTIQSSHYVKLVGDESVEIQNGNKMSYLLLLEGEPINEPVVAHGPFIATTKKEIVEAYEEYDKKDFGGWQWDVSDPVHDRNQGRFAVYSDGTIEEREKKGLKF